MIITFINQQPTHTHTNGSGRLDTKWANVNPITPTKSFMHNKSLFELIHVLSVHQCCAIRRWLLLRPNNTPYNTIRNSCDDGLLHRMAYLTEFLTSEYSNLKIETWRVGPHDSWHSNRNTHTTQLN